MAQREAVSEGVIGEDAVSLKAHAWNRAARHRALLDAAGLILIDLDGCLAFGNRPHPAAPAFLARHAGRCAILSNNSTETPEGLARILAGNGLSIDPGRILLAGSLTIDLLAAEHPGCRLLLLANPTMRAYAHTCGLRLSAVRPEMVAIARDTTLSYRKLGQAVEALCRGAGCVVSNPDLTHPGPDGLPVAETGSILRMLQACVPGLAFKVIGKPSRTMFDIALARFGISAAKTVMIGDNPKTDEVGARSAGILPILVGPGCLHPSLAALL